MNEITDVNTENFYDLFDLRPRKGDLKKMEIILAAIDVMAEEGIEKTTYDAIAGRIGTRRAHVAYYYKDKNDILMSAIRYIMANYQQILIENMKDEEDGLQMLMKYIEGPFIWAEKFPSQLKVMLLFYYLCTIKSEFKDLHDHIRTAGAERIQFILTNKLKTPLELDQAKLLSKIIQNSMSGQILDSATTHGRNLDQALSELKTFVLSLFRSQGENS
ncbi:MAG: hypothetical protein COW00_09575 [Bdellovibrio sp. CG12_big_fil_rev_8_21_14_0_65_39_13]|nr:MAG: hypothetical protein COW78_01570 [Bdellovibrio sp. CG22_combo_CG10-13_8_21_14_all_39_27]PIQ59628.1 MAG: hypothetical protein COW00_09575 [Bdellovibrio sp. CG12_big_fil_rev_8_21_14_0_65_39_13]